MKITPLGDSALLVRVHAERESNPEKCLRDVTTVFRRLQRAKFPGVIEVAPAFTTVTVFFDAAQVVAAGAPVAEISTWLAAQIRTALKANNKTVLPSAGHKVEIPVCYDAHFALDLEVVASRAGMTTKDVITAHAQTSYRVACLGFTPGFPYLMGLPKALATPRRATPRTHVPAGSVAIGGTHAGIYPQQSPGGWNVVGRTPLRLFDWRRKQPSLLAMGDAVRFRPITRAEFDAFSE